MTSPQPARPAGIIAQQIREIAAKGKDSARPEQAPFLPDLCSVSALAALVLMGELLALVLVLAVDGLRAFSWERLGLVSLAVQWVILPSAALLCRLRPRLARLSHRLAGGLSFAAVLAVLLAVMGAQQWWQALLSSAPFDVWRFARDSLLGAICAGVVLRYAYVQQQLYNQQQAELGARIDALQSRIRPHFLFNSMNSLASLIAIDPERAERLVEDLSALFRASLADSRLVPLQQELALARRYLDIESLRLGERLQQHWDVPDELGQLEVPSMLLQPLLENAVLHGVARLRAGGQIAVQINIENGRLLVAIDNPVPAAGEASGSADGNGIATDNIRQRLAAHYGDRFAFAAGRDGDRYRVQLLLPLARAGAGRQAAAEAAL
ncbi:two-component system, LytT family, sensor histidine kinase AlgZ [Microbulbifer donghaiensis]|uniref:Two-component system, LytT family, sensor histidine kinase AlgZ n=1 Tax=Microbulbifer donghaiensis TaxID=494016 RepID=A0A1M5EPM7_9GAMM|nr:sensor histidine kinase [Microbulbifer donghaiensis]SHF81169.1 two-component system, LytT family, sensor histidine kinase AlgZ [Microbulbifer donghaiensis]